MGEEPSHAKVEFCLCLTPSCMPTFATKLWVVSKVQVPQAAARESKGS
jgi:hypothetical protein